MHLFFAIVAAGITLYLLRNWWERFQMRRAERRLERAFAPPAPESKLGPWLFAGSGVAVLVLIAAVTFSH